MDIKYVKDNAGNNFFPLAHEKGVVDNNGTTLESKLQHKQDTLTFDDTPTANSNNPVKSSGIYQAIQNLMGEYYAE